MYLGTGYGSKGRELFAQTLIIQTVIQIFDVEIDTLVQKKIEKLLKFNISTLSNEDNVCMTARQGFIKQTDLVSGHAVLLHLLKLAFEFILTFALLLRTTHVNLSTIELFAVHVIHSLQDTTKARLKTKPPKTCLVVQKGKVQ